MTRILYTILLLLFILPAGAQEAFTIEVIPLNNRTPDQVIEIIRPLLPPGGSVSGMNNQLIVKTTRSNLNEIKNVLSSIDTAQRRLLISVAQNRDAVAKDLEQSLSGRVDAGNSSISSRREAGQSGGVVISGTDSEGNTIDYRLLNNRSSSESNNTYSVQALDGEPAFIQAGLSVPVSNRNTVITRNGVVVQDTVEYQDATSGFYVLPRLSGDRVTLMVAPRTTSVNPGRYPTFNVQNVETTVSGRLGEWMQIGGLDQSSQSNSRYTLGGGSNQRQDSRTIFIKVEEIR